MEYRLTDISLPLLNLNRPIRNAMKSKFTGCFLMKMCDRPHIFTAHRACKLSRKHVVELCCGWCTAITIRTWLANGMIQCVSNNGQLPAIPRIFVQLIQAHTMQISNAHHDSEGPPSSHESSHDEIESIYQINER